MLYDYQIKTARLKSHQQFKIWRTLKHRLQFHPNLHLMGFADVSTKKAKKDDLEGYDL